MIRLLRLSVRNLGRNRRRNFATGAAVACGFAAALLIIGYVNRAAGYLRTYSIYALHSGHIVAYKKDGLEKYSLNPKAYSLDAQDQRKIEAVLRGRSDIERFSKELYGSGFIGNGCKSFPFFIRGIEPEAQAWALSHPEMARWAPNLTAMTRGKGLWHYPESLGAIAVSEGLARLLEKPRVHEELRAGAPLRVLTDCQAPSAREEIAADANVQLVTGNWHGSLGAADGEIVAHFSTGMAETDAVAVLADLRYLQKLFDTENVARLGIWLRDPSRLERVLAELRAGLEAQGAAIELYPWNSDEVSPFYVGTVNFLQVLSGFIALVLGCLVTLSVFSTATMTVIERSREIGTLRALGFTQPQIRGLFLLENLALVLGSIMAGAILGGLCILLVNSLGLQFSPPGAVGSIPLLLVVDARAALAVALAILALSSATIWLAMRSTSAKDIPVLLMKVER